MNTTIWTAFAFMVLTNSYGDVHYKAAGLCYLNRTVKPAYGSREAVYTGIRNGLETATAAPDTPKTKAICEVLCSGDTARWKKFGHPLLSRAAMRFPKIKSAIADAGIGSCIQTHPPALPKRWHINTQYRVDLSQRPRNF